MLRGEDFRTVRADGGESVWLRPELTAILVEREEQHRLESLLRDEYARVKVDFPWRLP